MLKNLNTSLPEYRVKRGKRRSIAIHVIDGMVEVRAPRFVSNSEIDSWVNEKADWIHNQLSRQATLQREKPDISHGGNFLFLGEDREIEFAHGKPAILEKENKIIITHYGNTNTLKLLENWLKQEAQLYLTERVNEVAVNLQATDNITKIQFRKTKSKWGHCTSHGVLQFNWLIIMAPPDLIDYLIIHEISHLSHMNHSTEFWQLVEKSCPDYKTHKQWLNNNGHRLWL